MTNQHSIEPITREEREWIKDDTLPNRFPEEVHALFAYEAALRASEAREKRLQAELDALNDDGALHTAYLSGQQDAKERISALEQREKKLREALGPFSDFSEIFSDESWSDTDKLEIYIEGSSRLLWTISVAAFRRARQALGE